MINIDSRLLDILNGDELSVFCHILKRIDSNMECFPSQRLIRKETGYGREKVMKSINSLESKNIISRSQKKGQGGKFDKTIYKIETELSGVYINAHGFELKDYGDTENRTTEKPLTGKQPLSIKHPLSNYSGEVPTLQKSLDLNDNLKEKPQGKNPVKKKVSFHNSKWNNYETVRVYLMANKEYVKRYKGVDLKHYIEKVGNWCDKSGKVTTDRGWIAYIRDFMNDAIRENKLVLKKVSEKRAADLTVSDLAKKRKKSGGHVNF